VRPPRTRSPIRIFLNHRIDLSIPVPIPHD
jgi:hypothetical protein